MSSTLTADEVFNSVTGFDEIAIAKHFGQQFHQIIPNKETGTGAPFGFLRVLAFVELRHGGMNDRDAYKQAMDLSVAEANGYFAEPEHEIDPDAPETDLGKGSSPSA